MKTIRALAALAILVSTFTVPAIAFSSETNSLCPTPAEGECVYKHELGAYKASYAKNIIGMLNILSTPPSELAKAAFYKIGANYGKEFDCKLRAICFTTSYTLTVNNIGTENDSVTILDSSSWYIDFPIVITINEETSALGIPIILDYRGPEGQKTTITTIDGAFKYGVTEGEPMPCGITFKGKNIYAAGFVVENMPGDGICDDSGTVDLNLEDVGSNGNGGNGITINGTNAVLTNVETNYNNGSGIVVNGSAVSIFKSKMINNALNGLNVAKGATDVSVVDSTIAGNKGGNIRDYSGTLKMQNVSEECPEGYTLGTSDVCEKDCADGEFDFLGECVAECPEGYAPDSDEICRQQTLSLAANEPPILSDDGGSCTLLAGSAEGKNQIIYLLISFAPLIGARYRRNR